jgi:hypothetical protein
VFRQAFSCRRASCSTSAYSARSRSCFAVRSSPSHAHSCSASRRVRSCLASSRRRASCSASAYSALSHSCFVVVRRGQQIPQPTNPPLGCRPSLPHPLKYASFDRIPLADCNDEPLLDDALKAKAREWREQDEDAVMAPVPSRSRPSRASTSAPRRRSCAIPATPSPSPRWRSR